MNHGSRFMFDGNGDGSQQFDKKTSMSSSSSNFNKELFDPQKIFSLLSRHIWVIIFCVLLSVSGVYYLVNYYFHPVYQSSGTILISLNESTLPGSDGVRGDIGSGLSEIISRSFTLNEGNSVQSAIYLFQSRDVSLEIAKNLKDSLRLNSINKYPTLWLEYPEDSAAISIDQVASRIRRGLSVEPVEPESNILNIRNPNLLEVSYNSYSSDEAADVVNLALGAFQEKSLQQKQNIASKALSFLEGKKSEIRNLLTEAEDRLVNFKNENELVAIDAQAGNSVNTLSQLKAEKQNYEIQLESITASIQNFERQMEAIKPGLANQYSKAIGPTIQQYQDRLAELRGQRFVILSNNPQLKSNENSEPQLRQLNQQISDLETEIQALSDSLLKQSGGLAATTDGNLAQELVNIERNLIQLRIEKNQFDSQIQVLTNRIEEVQSFLNTFPDKQAKLARLEAEVQRYKQLFNGLTTQESEIALWEQTQNSSGTIMDKANPVRQPVSPNKILWLCSAIMLGLLIPIAILLIKSSVSSTINSLEQLDSYPYPLLSVVYDSSLLKNKGGIFKKNKNAAASNISENIVFYHHNDTPIAESYRKIVSQILYSNKELDPQSILITSSGQGEGKTTLTGNIGAAFAEIDKKVLIIDCDFRRPAIHRLFSLENSLGIKEVILDGGKLSEAIKGTGIQNLSVLTSGSKPVSPAKLLSSDKFKEMVKVVKPNFDIILIDTPPQGLVSDVASLQNLVDLLIVTAKFGQTNDNVLNQTLVELDKNKNSHISLVLTCYDPANSYDSVDTKDLYSYRYQQYYEYEKIEKGNN